jgi:DNA-binding transcriptional regulator YhcF (GntR family)
MKKSPFYKLLYFDDFSVTPKYQQLANCIIKGIEEGKLQVGDVLPSINELSFHFEICRDTAEKGYKALKLQGLVNSVPGKGYFIQRADLETKIKVFLMFNKLSPHKKIIYDSFVKTLGSKVSVDFYVYNNDLSLFRKLLENSRTDYDYYVIIPHFIEGGDKAPQLINQIDKHKLILLDKILPQVSGDFSAVYEDFEKDIYAALEQGLAQLKKYHTLQLITPANSYYPQEITTGFVNFCQEYAFNHGVIHDIALENLQKGTVYINLMDDDLVTLVEKAIVSKWKVGADLGIISYNETPLKKIILNGITTISSDFETMGSAAAQIVLEGKKNRLAVPFCMNIRSSL